MPFMKKASFFLQIVLTIAIWAGFFNIEHKIIIKLL